MRVLVTGAEGFVGRHMVHELEAAGHVPIRFALDRKLDPRAEFSGNLRDPAVSEHAVPEARPDACIHLAGIAFVPRALERPAESFDINVNAALHLLDALRRHAPQARVLIASSAQIYGRPQGAGPVAESQPAQPESLYAVTKAAIDEAARIYAAHHRLHVMTARPNNHIGPGQSPHFVIPAFARQLLAIHNGQAHAVMRVGNLDSRRDFLDVRDVVRAYRLLLEHGAPCEAYNVASGELVRIGDALDMLQRLIHVRPAIEVDPALYRPTDSSAMLDTTKIRTATGWHPLFTMEQSMTDILAELRAAPA